MKYTKKMFLPFLVLSVFLFGCGDSSKKVETTEKQEVTKASDEAITLPINVNNSIVEWLGKKVTGQHNGTVKINGGEVILKDGVLKGGSFEMDMNSITVLDLQNPEPNAKLTNHLKSDDFFDSENHPMSKFEITTITEQIDDKGNTHVVSGNLTLKGITKNISFPAMVSVDERSVKATADFDIDRTEWDVRYGSGKFFDNLGDNLISDNFNIKFTVSTE